MSEYKIGDRVFVPSFGDLREVVDIRGGLYYTKSATNGTVYSSGREAHELVPEDVYNSSLYKALHEEEE